MFVIGPLPWKDPLYLVVGSRPPVFGSCPHTLRFPCLLFCYWSIYFFWTSFLSLILPAHPSQGVTASADCDKQSSNSTPYGQEHIPLGPIGLYQVEYLKRTKSAVLNSREVSLLSDLSNALRISQISPFHGHWSQGCFTIPVSSSLLMRTRSSITPLLAGFSIPWRRKLPSMHFRNLLDCLCSALLSFQ